MLISIKWSRFWAENHFFRWHPPGKWVGWFLTSQCFEADVDSPLKWLWLYGPRFLIERSQIEHMNIMKKACLLTLAPKNSLVQFFCFFLMELGVITILNNYRNLWLLNLVIWPRNEQNIKKKCKSNLSNFSKLSNLHLKSQK